MNNTIASIRMLAVLSLVCGAAYPLAVTIPAKLFWPAQAEGSLIQKNGQVLGSSLLAQKTQSDKYFWPRPSACDYNASNSSGSNKGPTAADLKKTVEGNKAALLKAHPGAGLPPEDLLYASGSGLDPHISPAAARYQAARVAKARNLDVAKVLALVDARTEGPQGGFFGEPRVNVLRLNLDLDALP
jgi:K+-transporting ATPase ATPase C chain